MKKPLLLFLILLVSNFLKAQDSLWAPGTKWYYEAEKNIGAPYPFYGPLLIEVIKDSTFKGKICRYIIASTPCYYPFSENLIYHENGKVYKYSDSINDFFLIYDFTKNIGETYEIKSHPSCSGITVKVDSVSSISVNGKARKMLYADYGYKPVVIIEGIGSISDYLFPDFDFMYTCNSDPNIIYDCWSPYASGFRCFIDAEGNQYKLIQDHDCDETYTKLAINDQFAFDGIDINYDGEIININCENLQGKTINTVSIFSTDGKKIFNSTYNQNNIFITSDNFNSGIVMIEVITSDKRIYRKKAVIIR